MTKEKKERERKKYSIVGWKAGKNSKEYRARLFKLLRSPGIDSASLCSLADRYDNTIPFWFLAPIDCYKIPAL
jgi:hypothetical protein